MNGHNWKYVREPGLHHWYKCTKCGGHTRNVWQIPEKEAKAYYVGNRFKSCEEAVIYQVMQW